MSTVRARQSTYILVSTNTNHESSTYVHCVEFSYHFGKLVRLLLFGSGKRLP